MSEGAVWRPMWKAPKDGTWILLRGRNSAGRTMVPVVVAWRTDPMRPSTKYGWYDSSGNEQWGLITDVPPGHAADWAPLPDWRV